jgi:nitroreductase
MTSSLTGRRAVAALVGDAVRAPSSHNTQPWRFRVDGDTVALYADRGRALPENDPDDRELVISCGAALRPAIAARRTRRGAFARRPVPDGLLAALTGAAATDGTWAKVLDESQRPMVADLVADGNRIQFSDTRWRRELAGWMRPRRTRDGRTVPPVVGAMTRLVVARADLGRRMGRRDAALTTTAPLVMVLGTDEDDAASWLRLGSTLQRLLLTATSSGLQAGFVNQPCQVRSLRPELARLLGRDNPQIVLRLGFARGARRPSTRRDVGEVLEASEAGSGDENRSP